MTLRDIGLALVRGLPGLDPLARRLYARLPAALHDTPTSRLRAFFAGDDRVSFVQIGAYDGLAGDPIRPLVVERDGWRGVLVEPQPDAFAALVENYRAQAARLYFVNAAVAERVGERTLYVVPAEEADRLGLPDWVRETASFSREHIRKHVETCDIREITVKTLPFAELASRLPEARVDLLVVDVEGYERGVLETVDFDRHRVRAVVYEHKHLSAPDAEALLTLWRRHGFRTKAFGRDTLAWRERT